LSRLTVLNDFLDNLSSLYRARVNLFGFSNFPIYISGIYTSHCTSPVGKELNSSRGAMNCCYIWMTHGTTAGLTE